MTHEIRRKDRALSEQEAYAILAKGSDGVLATLGEDGYPYAVPLNYVLADGALYLHCALAGHKLDNIDFCDKVSYCVVTERDVLPAELSTQYESAVVFGRAVLVTDPAEKRKGLQALLQRFAPGYLEQARRFWNAVSSAPAWCASTFTGSPARPARRAIRRSKPLGLTRYLVPPTLCESLRERDHGICGVD